MVSIGKRSAILCGFQSFPETEPGLAGASTGWAHRSPNPLRALAVAPAGSAKIGRNVRDSALGDLVESGSRSISRGPSRDLLGSAFTGGVGIDDGPKRLRTSTSDAVARASLGPNPRRWTADGEPKSDRSLHHVLGSVAWHTRLVVDRSTRVGGGTCSSPVHGRHRDCVNHIHQHNLRAGGIRCRL